MKMVLGLGSYAMRYALCAIRFSKQGGEMRQECQIFLVRKLEGEGTAQRNFSKNSTGDGRRKSDAVARFFCLKEGDVARRAMIIVFDWGR